MFILFNIERGGCGVGSEVSGAAREKKPRLEATLATREMVLCFGVLPIAFNEPWDRNPGLNTFHKRGEDQTKEVYFSPSCSFGGLGGAWKC